MGVSEDRPSIPSRKTTIDADERITCDAQQDGVEMVAILELLPGESPRLEGEDRAHIAWLAETDSKLPPILVDRRTMRVIDGMHRLLASSLRGRDKIEVEFFDGPPTEAFLRAVEANVTHGLPLSQADRRAAATRIVESHPHLSDRSIGESTGLAAKTVATIRRCSTDDTPQTDVRVGKDGKARPLDGTPGRMRAAKLLSLHPHASLRAVAREAGISPTTASDVRKRLANGLEPARRGRRRRGRRAEEEPDQANGSSESAERDGRPGCPADTPQAMAQPGDVLGKLLRDPSLRHNDEGRQLLRLLQHTAVGMRETSGVATAVPAHCTGLVMRLARMYGHMWLKVADELDERARIADPWSGTERSGRTWPT